MIGIELEGVNRPTPATTDLGCGNRGGIVFLGSLTRAASRRRPFRPGVFLEALAGVLLVATKPVYSSGIELGQGLTGAWRKNKHARAGSYHKVTGEG
jgi:hypothetical protein